MVRGCSRASRGARVLPKMVNRSRPPQVEGAASPLVRFAGAARSSMRMSRLKPIQMKVTVLLGGLPGLPSHRALAHPHLGVGRFNLDLREICAL